MKIAKRFLALLLALTLLVGNVVTPVLATEPAAEETQPTEEIVLVPEETEAPEATTAETEESREPALNGETEEEPVPGESPENPIMEYYMGMGSINGTVGANATVYYSVYGIANMIMTIENAGALTVNVNGVDYTANENGTISFTVPAGMMGGRMPVNFTVSNSSEAEVSFAMTFAFPVGTMDNPAELTEGETTVSLDAGSQGYYFTYTAEERGTLTMSISAGDVNWMYVINNLTSYVYGSEQTSLDETVVNPAVVSVNKGDELQIMVNTLDPDNRWSAPAGDVTLEVSFEAAVGTAMNPAFVNFVMNDEYTAGEATINVPANTTYYCQAYNVGGMILSVNGVDTAILPAAMGRMPVNFTVTNDTDADAEMVLSVRYPEGSQMNPDVIENLGAQNVYLAEGDYEGYYYTYTAEQDAILCFQVNSVSTEVDVDICVTNMNTYAMTTISADGADGKVNVPVSAGDVLNIQVVILPDANWNIAAAVVEWDINYPLGSEWNYDYPEFVWNEDNTEATATIIVPANTTYYVAAYRVGGMILTINGENPVMLESAGMWSPTVFTVVNDTDEAAEYVLTLSYPVGSQMNPAELSVYVEGESWDETEGQNVAELEADNWNGYLYSWTAPADGTLTVTMDNGVAGWSYALNNMTAYKYGDNHYSNDGSSNTETIAVSAGDEIQLMVNTCGEPGSYTTPAGKVYFQAYFEKTLGTEANPELVEFAWNELYTEATAEVTVPANTVYYVQGYISGMMLSIDGAEPTLMTAANPRMPVIFSLNNETEEAVTYQLKITYPYGTYENPTVVETGMHEIETLEGGDGKYYSFIAPDDGVVTVGVGRSDAGFQYFIENMTTGVMTDTHWSDDEVVTPSDIMNVSKGDKIRIFMNTYDPANPWTAPGGAMTFFVEFEANEGTESNPIMIMDPQEWITGEVAANSTKYYMARGIAGMNLQFFAYSSDVYLQIDGQTYTSDKDGMIEITVPGSPMNRMPITIAVVNDGEYDSTFDFGMYYPIGSMNNPDYMVIGKNTAEIEANSQGYYYSFEAQKNGYLTITMSGKNWTYAINKKVWNYDWQDYEYIYGDIQAASDGSKTQTIYVQCGDQIEIVLGTENWKAGKVSFTAAYNEKEINLVSGKSVALSFTDPATGKAVSSSKVNWAITEIWVFGEYDGSASNEELANMITINTSGKITTKAGIDSAVVAIVEASLKSDADVGNTFQVYVRPAAKSMEIWSINERYDEEVDGYFWDLDENITGKTIDWNINENYNYIMQAVVAPEDALGEVTWKSSNTKVAVVDDYGMVRPVWNNKTYTYNSGIVTITATAKDGSGVKASVKLNVYALATDVYVYSQNDMYRVTAGKTLQMAAFVDNANSQDVKWELQVAELDDLGNPFYERNNEGEPIPASVATINAKGVLTANKNLTERTFVKVIATAKDGSGAWGYEYVCIDPATAKVEIYSELENNTFDMNSWWPAFYLSASALDKAGNELYATEILWKSSNTKVATITDWGEVECLKPGKVTFTATANDGTGKKASITVNIVKSPYQIVLDETYTTAATKALTIKAEVLDADATNKNLTWTLGEETAEIAAAIGAKLVKGKLTVDAKKYNAYIAENGLNFVELLVNVQTQMADAYGDCAFASTTVAIYPATTKVAISNYGKDVTGAALSMDINGSMVLSASSNPEAAAQAYTWKSSNTKIADVKVNRDGSVTVIPTGAKTGKVTITATATDGTNKSAKVTVNVVKSVKSLKINNDGFVLAGGKSFDLNKLLEINPSDATNKKVTWSISNNTVGAKLDAKGKLTTKAVETKTTLYVTVKAQDGFGATATAAITIYPATKDVLLFDIDNNDITKKTVTTQESYFVFEAAPSNEGAATGYTVKLSDDKHFGIDVVDGRIAVVQVADAKGNVKYGNVKLTVTANDGTNKSAYVTINFVKPAAE